MPGYWCSAINHLIAKNIQPVKVHEGSKKIKGLIVDLQNEIKAGPSSWLAEAIIYAATVLIRLYQKRGLQFLLRKTGLLRLFKLEKAEALIPEADISNLAERYRTNKRHRGNIG
ncbi:MAG: hypothetical protein PHG00_16910 [Methylococcales bacterium]|nr:hypothetical protein [Methylococcales bacterium]